MNITKLPSGSYRIRETVNGITYSKTVKFKPKKYEAEQIIADMVSTGEVSAERMSVEVALKRCIAAKEKVLSPSTVAGYLRYINKYPESFLKAPLSSLTDENIQALVGKFAADGKSTKYIKNLMTPLIDTLTMFRPKYIVRITYPPAKKKKEPYIPVDDDIKKLAEYIEGTEYEIPIKLAVLGLRRSEICALTIEDVGDCKITINKSKVQDKNKKWVIKENMKTVDSTREIEIPKDLELKIRKQGYIFNKHPERIYDFLQKAIKKLGLNQFALHKLRHYYASSAHAMNIPDAYIMKSGGWKTDTVLKKVYRHAQKDKTEEFSQQYIDHLDSLFS